MGAETGNGGARGKENMAAAKAEHRHTPSTKHAPGAHPAFLRIRVLQVHTHGAHAAPRSTHHTAHDTHAEAHVAHADAHTAHAAAHTHTPTSRTCRSFSNEVAGEPAPQPPNTTTRRPDTAVKLCPLRGAGGVPDTVALRQMAMRPRTSSVA